MLNGEGLEYFREADFELRDRFHHRDIRSVLNPDVPEGHEPKACSCGDVLKGIKIPTDCALFGKACTPEKPVGACMVSSEGSCSAYYRYMGMKSQHRRYGQ